MRDCFSVAPRVRTRLLATRCRAPGEPDDSRIATQPLHGEPGIPIASGREFGLHDSYVHRHPIRWPALRWDNRNPKRNRRTDVGDEICSLRNFGSASVAKERVQAQLPSFAALERDPQRSTLAINASSEKPFADTLTSILSPQPGRGGGALSAVGFSSSHEPGAHLSQANNEAAPLAQYNWTLPQVPYQGRISTRVRPVEPSWTLNPLSQPVRGTSCFP